MSYITFKMIYLAICEKTVKYDPEDPFQMSVGVFP